MKTLDLDQNSVFVDDDNDMKRKIMIIIRMMAVIIMIVNGKSILMAKRCRERRGG